MYTLFDSSIFLVTCRPTNNMEQTDDKDSWVLLLYRVCFCSFVLFCYCFGYAFAGLFYFAFARAHDVLSRNRALHVA